MANSNTDHSRQLRQTTANARIAALKADGWQRLTIMLPPDAVASLERLTQRYGSKQAAIAEALTDADRRG